MMTRVYTIQYLRAFAALAVVALHSGNRVDAHLPDGMVSVLSLGHAGVDLFFVISGFIMWSVTRGRNTTPGDFMLRRLIRIAPPYWIAVGLLVAFAIAADVSWLVVTPSYVGQTLLFVPHFHPTHTGHIWPILVPGWTLNYEMFFYFVFAACLFLPERSRLIGLSGVMIGLVTAGLLFKPTQAWAITYSSPLLLEFLAGCLIAEIWARRETHMMRDLVALTLGMVLFSTLAPDADPHDYLSRTIGYGLPAVLVTLGVVGLGARAARVRWLETLGDASYAIYLFHLFVVQAMAEVWVRLPELHNTLTAIGFVILTVTFSAALGVALYHRMERPLLKLLNSIFLSKQGERHLARR